VPHPGEGNESWGFEAVTGIGHGDLIAVGSAGSSTVGRALYGTWDGRGWSVVTASLALPAACGEWRGGNYRLGDRVVQTENRTGLPSGDGTEFLIRPSAIPTGALLWVGIAQTGRPEGVVGPPGTMSFGYLTAGQACARS
jgi:hypothetical protein